jgi:hypothetical protein
MAKNERRDAAVTIPERLTSAKVVTVAVIVAGVFFTREFSSLSLWPSCSFVLSVGGGASVGLGGRSRTELVDGALDRGPLCDG